MLVHKDALLEKSPAAVDDLCAGFDFEGLPLSTGQLVGDDPHIVGALPLPYPVDLHSLFAVNRLVVQDPRKLELGSSWQSLCAGSLCDPATGIV